MFSRSNKGTIIMVDAHLLWVKGNFTNFQKICIKSIIRAGFKVNIWTYGGLDNCPHKANVRNANDVISEENVFLNRQGSYASFSDLFRYALLSTIGGLYLDTDVFAVKSAVDFPSSKKFLVTERIHSVDGRVKINNNVIYNPSPRRGDVLDLAFAYSSRFKKTDINWGEIGPDLLTAICSIYPEHGYEVKDPNFANPIDYWDCPELLLKPHVRLDRRSVHFLHLYNEMWNRKGGNQNQSYPEGSIMDAIFKDRSLLL